MRTCTIVTGALLAALPLVFQGCTPAPSTWLCHEGSVSWTAADRYFITLDEVAGEVCKRPARYYANSEEQANTCAAGAGAVSCEGHGDVPWCSGARPTRPYLYCPSTGADDTAGGTRTCSGANAGTSARRHTVVRLAPYLQAPNCVYEEHSYFANSMQEAINCGSGGGVTAVAPSAICGFAFTICSSMFDTKQAEWGRSASEARSCIQAKYPNATVTNVTAQVLQGQQCLPYGQRWPGATTFPEC